MKKASFSARERWRQIIEQQEHSGLSVARFCRDHGVAESSLFAWKRRLARKTEPTGTPAFVAITATAADDHTPRSRDGAIELHLGDGRHLLLRPPVHSSTLAAVLALLGAGKAEGR
jgi:transposase-like protein